MRQQNVGKSGGQSGRITQALLAPLGSLLRVRLLVQSPRGVIAGALHGIASSAIAPQHGPISDHERKNEDQHNGGPEPEPSADFGIHDTLPRAGQRPAPVQR